MPKFAGPITRTHQVHLAYVNKDAREFTKRIH